MRGWPPARHPKLELRREVALPGYRPFATFFGWGEQVGPRSASAAAIGRAIPPDFGWLTRRLFRESGRRERRSVPDRPVHARFGGSHDDDHEFQLESDAAGKPDVG